jgi:flagellar assembly protein FliH
MREIATANEQIILRIINQILRKILLKEVAEDKEFIKRHVAAIIDRLGTRENIKIFISPQSFKDLETIRADLLSSISGLKNITIDVDANLTSYGCRVETEYGDVDATIDAQLQNISALLNISEAQ